MPKRPSSAACTADTPAQRDRQTVTALTRGIQILQCFNKDNEELGATQIAQLTGLPQPTVWRLCYTLCRLGFLRQTGRNEKLRLGAAALTFAYSALSSIDLAQISRHRMQELASRYQIAVGLALRVGLDMVFIERCQGQGPLAINLQVGSRVPIVNTAYGWAYLAALEPADRDPLMRELAAAHIDQWDVLGPAIEAVLAEYETTGYVMNHGFYSRHVKAIGVPVRLARSGTIYSLGASGPSQIATRKLLRDEVSPELVALGRYLQLAGSGAPETN